MQPIPLITIDNNGDLTLTKEGKATLSQIQENVGVVAIVARYRKGKSFSLNSLLGNYTVFKVGHTKQALTKGIWLVVTEAQTGQSIRLIFLDSEV